MDKSILSIKTRQADALCGAHAARLNTTTNTTTTRQVTSGNLPQQFLALGAVAGVYNVSFVPGITF